MHGLQDVSPREVPSILSESKRLRIFSLATTECNPFFSNINSERRLLQTRFRFCTNPREMFSIEFVVKFLEVLQAVRKLKHVANVKSPFKCLQQPITKLRGRAAIQTHTDGGPECHFA